MDPQIWIWIFFETKQMMLRILNICILWIIFSHAVGQKMAGYQATVQRVASSIYESMMNK